MSTCLQQEVVFIVFSFDDNILYNKIEKKISGSRSTYTFRAQIPGYKLTPLFRSTFES